jgi:hypothetical protein
MSARAARRLLRMRSASIYGSGGRAPGLQDSSRSRPTSAAWHAGGGSRRRRQAERSWGPAADRERPFDSVRSVRPERGQRVPGLGAVAVDGDRLEARSPGDSRPGVSMPSASAITGAVPSAACAASGSCVLRSDDDPVGWVQDRFVLLVPANAVVLVFVVAEQLDDLAVSRWLAMQPVRLDPVAYMCRCCP